VFKEGDVVFSEGSPGGEMYVLVSGEVELRKRVGSGERVLKIVKEPNDFFGEMALVDDAPRSATAVASAPTELLLVNQASFEHMVTTNGQFAVKIIKVLSERLRNANAEIRHLVETSPREQFKQGMVEFAMKHGETTYNKGLRVDVAEMKAWIHQHLGMPEKEIEAHLFRLIKANDTKFSSSESKSRKQIVLNEEFLNRTSSRGV
jgi:CRP-like cAMP-binding protein